MGLASLPLPESGRTSSRMPSSTARPTYPGLTEDSLRDWLAPAQEEWQGGVPWDRVPWHGEAKARAGAFATVLGLTVAATPDNPYQFSWQAVAVGDACLFVVRHDRLPDLLPTGRRFRVRQ